MYRKVWYTETNNWKGFYMITKEQIEEVKKRLIEVYDPLEIYLFGSHAWGHPTNGSDLDLLIVVEESDDKRHKRSIPGSRALMGLMIPTDLLVLTKDEFNRRVNDVTTLCHKIVKEGKKIYARA